MGAGVGKMFGIDKIFGGFLDSIGLGALKPLVNIAFDFATGNVPGVLQDLTSLMSSFGKGDFTNNVSSRQPLPDAFNSNNDINDPNRTDDAQRDGAVNNCCRDNNSELSSNRLAEFLRLLSDIISGKNSSDQMHKLTQMMKLLSDNAQNRQLVQDNRTSVQFSNSVTLSA